MCASQSMFRGAAVGGPVGISPPAPLGRLRPLPRGRCWWRPVPNLAVRRARAYRPGGPSAGCGGDFPCQQWQLPRLKTSVAREARSAAPGTGRMFSNGQPQTMALESLRASVSALSPFLWGANFEVCSPLSPPSSEGDLCDHDTLNWLPFLPCFTAHSLWVLPGSPPSSTPCINPSCPRVWSCPLLFPPS